MIQPIVEGFGEVPSVPIAIRRVAMAMGVYDLQVGRPIRRPRSKLVQADGLKASVTLAKFQTGVRGILIIFDADDDCPKEIAPELQVCASAAADPVPCSLVIANKEFETVFVAGIASLHNQRGILDPTRCNLDPDSVRDAKGWIERRMQPGRRYSEVTDQPALTAVVDWIIAHANSRSCRKLVKEIRQLLLACNLAPRDWPGANA
jgi:hypothetical protein